MTDLTCTDNLIAWMQRLARRPSEQSDLMERDPAILSFIKEEVKPLVDAVGAGETYIDDFGNLTLDVGPKNGDYTLAAFAYAMTHPRSTMTNPFGGELVDKDGTPHLRGRGISEQKSSLTASLAAFLQNVTTSRPKNRMTWSLLTAGETGRHDAIAAALKRIGAMPRYAFVMTGSNGEFSLGNRGRLDVEVIIEGKSAHSSSPEKGVDVTKGIAQILAKAAAVDANGAKHPVLGRASLTCTSIRTWPEATHTIQSRARMVFDRRLLPGDKPEDVVAELRSALTVEPPLRCQVEPGPFMYGAELPRDSDLLDKLRTALAAQSLEMPATYFADGALDLGYLQHHGVQCVKWGCGDPAQFHTDEEQVPVAAVELMAKRFLASFSYFGGRA